MVASSRRRTPPVPSHELLDRIAVPVLGGWAEQFQQHPLRPVSQSPSFTADQIHDAHGHHLLPPRRFTRATCSAVLAEPSTDGNHAKRMGTPNYGGQLSIRTLTRVRARRRLNGRGQFTGGGHMP